MAASDTDFHFVQASGNFSTPTVLTEPDQVATIEANAPKKYQFLGIGSPKVVKGSTCCCLGDHFDLNRIGGVNWSTDSTL